MQDYYKWLAAFSCNHAKWFRFGTSLNFISAQSTLISCLAKKKKKNIWQTWRLIIREWLRETLDMIKIPNYSEVVLKRMMKMVGGISKSINADVIARNNTVLIMQSVQLHPVALMIQIEASIQIYRVHRCIKAVATDFPHALSKPIHLEWSHHLEISYNRRTISTFYHFYQLKVS